MGDQPDFPNIYIDEGCAGTKVGSQANPYDDLADINWTTGGDNSVFDAVAANKDVVIHLKKGDTWRETMTVGTSGSATHPITITSYGTGTDPIINGADLMTTWIQHTAKEETGGLFASGLEDEVDAFTTDFDGKTEAGANALSVQASIKNSGDDAAMVDFDGANINCYASKAFTEQTSDCYVRFYLYLSDDWDENGNWKQTVCCSLRDGATNWLVIRIATQADGKIYLRCAYSGVGAIGDYEEIVKEQWYCIEMYHKTHATTGGGEWWIDTVSKGSSFVSNTSGHNPDNFIIGLYDSGAETLIPTADSELYFDDVKVDSSPIGLVDLTVANVWKKTGVTTEPYVVAFDGTYGDYEPSGIGSLDTEKEWFWASDVLYVYTTGGDPDSQWPSGIDVAQRNQIITLNNRDYINLGYIDLKYCNYDAIYLYNGSSNCNIEYCTITGTGANGIHLNNSSNNNTISHVTWSYGASGIVVNNTSNGNIIEYCDLSETRQTGKQTAAGGVVVYNGSDSGIIRYCYIHDARYVGPGRTGDGIFLEIVDNDADDWQIYYNVISKMNDGIDIAGTGHTVYNNTFYKISYPQYWIGNAGTTNNIIKNNIFYDSIVNNLLVHGDDCEAGNTIDYNCYYDPDNPSPSSGNVITWEATDESWGSMTWDAWVAHGKYDQNSIYADPKFVDAANGDFRLQSTSPCIDVGTDVGLTEDYDGNKVPS